jgi:RNA polymerase sigma factor (sigma-70 family)
MNLNSQAIAIIEQHNQEDLLRRLNAYAFKLIKYKNWLNDPILEGKEPKDFVKDAYISLYSGQRNWDFEKVDFVSFMKMTIKSLISNHTSKKRLELIKTNEGNYENYPESETDDGVYSELLSKFEAELANEDELLEVFYGLVDELKPSQISEQLQISVNEVNNRKKRIKRRLELIRKQFYQQRK